MHRVFVSVGFLMLFLASTVFAESAVRACETTDAHVKSVLTWEDGAIFINLDKVGNCGCEIKDRYGFYPTNQHAKTYVALALTAIATKNKVTIGGHSGCAIHENTAAIFSMALSSDK